MKNSLSKIIAFCTKHRFSCAIIAAISLIGVGAAVAQSIWLGNYKTKVANQAYFPTKNCINMAGGLEAPIEGEWGFKFQEDDFSNIKNKGFDTVRIPIDWSSRASKQSPYQIDNNFFKRTDEIIKWGLNQKLNIIINVHNYEEIYQAPDENTDRLVALWSQIAQHYRNAPQNLMFEIINEPRDAFSGDKMNQAQYRALLEIRKTNPTRTVIFSGDNWGTIGGMYNLNIPNDPYIVATVHHYLPFEFTHQGAEWLGAQAPPMGRDFPIGSDKKDLHNYVQKIAQWRTHLGIPVFVGEYGTSESVPRHLRARWAGEVTRELQMAQIPACYFNYNAGFGIYDRKSGWDKLILDSIIDQPQDELKLRR